MANEMIINNGIIFNTGLTDLTASFNALKLAYSGSSGTDYTSFIISGSKFSVNFKFINFWSINIK